MVETTAFTIGADVSCTDGACGEVSRLIVDPVADTVAHLVVEPKHRRGHGRLVPAGLADTSTGQIRLRCTRAEFEKLDPAEETLRLPEDYPTTTFLGGYDPALTTGRRHYVTEDSIPLGEAEVSPGEHVHATDGPIGQVRGFVVDPASRQVTHVLLQEGHLWGRKDAAIPINAVTLVDDEIRLSMSTQQVQDLPPVDIDHPGGSGAGAPAGPPP
jgi:hypothetical protein